MLYYYLLILINISISALSLCLLDYLFDWSVIDSYFQALGLSVFLIYFFGGVVTDTSHMEEEIRGRALARFKYSLVMLGVLIICNVLI
jgi:hypothetical protein